MLGRYSNISTHITCFRKAGHKTPRDVLCERLYCQSSLIMAARENTKSSSGGGTYITTKANKAIMQHGHLWNIL